MFEGKLTKSEARRIYGIGGQSTILAWMKKWNLIPNSCFPQQPRHYSDAFKRKIGKDVLTGKFTKAYYKDYSKSDGIDVLSNLEKSYI